MILGNAKVDKISVLFIEGKKIERVTEFMLLSVHISDDCRLESHINGLYNSVIRLLLLLLLLLLHPFNGPLSGTTQVSQYRYQKGKTSLDLLQQEIVNGSGIR